jgi:prolyl oligopeptidase
MTTDPYLWLETVESDSVLDWVRTQNQSSQNTFAQSEHFTKLQHDLLQIHNSKDKIPYIHKIGEYYYNLWRDEDHPQGIWRRTTLSSYRQPNPIWELVLDIDELGKAEGVNWVWAGSEALQPEYKRCLINLSRGGADASITREFDLETKQFVENGFYRPEAKGYVGWKDIDTVYVSTDLGEGSLTESGYPRTIREWQRGTPLAESKLIYESQTTDLHPYLVYTADLKHKLIYRVIAFYNNELFLLQDDDSLVPIPAPNDAEKSIHRDWLFLQLRSPLEQDELVYPAGSLLATSLQAYLAGDIEYQVLFTPDAHSSLDHFVFTRDYVVLNILRDVKSELQVFALRDNAWEADTFVGAPTLGTVYVDAVDSAHSNAYFMTVTDFITPSTLYYGEMGQPPEVLKQSPAFFDASNLAISQHFATSVDDTQIPYFQIAAKNLELNGKNPTLLYGYGGFEISLTPSYSAAVGRAWLSEGGVYVVANIRGGGEYGTQWHQAALKEKRHKAYEDFAAVAQDLIARQVTSPAHLGAMGGSNGGLLMGNMLTTYSELFGAIVCAVPLLDMQRFHLLLAGASWVAEYGHPETEDWAFLQKYSPYHNVSAAKHYPPILFTTSTRDDRVHPAHARKMFAVMQAQRHEVYYYENIEGGHGGAANNEQAAYLQALEYSFLWGKLGK